MKIIDLNEANSQKLSVVKKKCFQHFELLSWVLNLSVGAQRYKYVLGWVVRLVQEGTGVFDQLRFEEYQPYRILTPKKDRAQSVIYRRSLSVKREILWWDENGHTTPPVLILSVSYGGKLRSNTYLNISPLGVSSTSSWNKIGLINVEHYFPLLSSVMTYL